MNSPLTTTLAAIRKHGPCEEGWTKLLRHLSKTKADDEQLLIETILGSNGLDDALWCLCVLGHEHQRTWRLFAVWCARRVEHLMEDPRSIAVLDVAERHANGEASDKELAAARDAAWIAWDHSWSASRSVTFAAMSAYRSASSSVTWAAMSAASADRYAMSAASDAGDADWAAQTAKFREICRAGEFVEDRVEDVVK